MRLFPERDSPLLNMKAKECFVIDCNGPITKKYNKAPQRDSMGSKLIRKYWKGALHLLCIVYFCGDSVMNNDIGKCFRKARQERGSRVHSREDSGKYPGEFGARPWRSQIIWLQNSWCRADDISVVFDVAAMLFLRRWQSVRELCGALLRGGCM